MINPSSFGQMPVGQLCGAYLILCEGLDLEHILTVLMDLLANDDP
jgi:hypothetical protein